MTQGLNISYRDASFCLEPTIGTTTGRDVGGAIIILKFRMTPMGFAGEESIPEDLRLLTLQIEVEHLEPNNINWTHIVIPSTHFKMTHVCEGLRYMYRQLAVI